MNVSLSEHTIRISIITPHERIDAFNAPELQAQIDPLLAGAIARFVIDLSAVPFLDSAGMAVLVRLLKKARQAGGDVVLVWPREEATKRTLHLTKFDRIFTMVDSVADAIRQIN